MNPINPEKIRCIKLGHGGSWTQLAFERSELPFGYPAVSHDICLRGDWETVTRSLRRDP